MTSYKPFIALIAGLVLTALVWSGLSYIEQRNAQAEFAYEADQISETISKRLSSYEKLLTGVKAFFMASEEVSLEEWQIYFDKLRFEEHYPGLHGVAYLKRIRSQRDLDELLEQLRGYGMDDFAIKPEGERAEYYPVIFLDPLNESNKKAIGYDIFSEKIRRDAIEYARGSGTTSITRKIILVQEGENNVQSGLLMMVPFFKHERIGGHDAAHEIDGIIDGVIRMDDFIRAYINPVFLQNMHLKIYDHELAEENVLFDSMKGPKPASFRGRFSNQQVVHYYGQDWIIALEGQPAANFLPLFFGQKSKNLNLIILIAGCGLSGLGFFITRGLQTTARLRKEKLADALSIKADMDIIRRQEESLLKFREKSEHLIVCIIDIVNSTSTTAELSGRESAQFYSTFHNVMSKIILSHDGTIVKSMGDAVLYSFQASNPPTKDECLKAIDCCLDMIGSHAELNSILKQKSLPGIDYRISAVHGPVMTASKNGISDIFGSTVNQCSKINRFAGANGLVVSKGIQTLLAEEHSYQLKRVEHDTAVKAGEGVYRISRSGQVSPTGSP